MKTIGFIGAGNMAEAIIKGIIASGMYTARNVMASDVREDRLQYLSNQYGINTTRNNTELAGYAEIVFLSVKPQNMAEMLNGIAGKFLNDVLVISIAAGITTRYLHGKLGDHVQVIRTMPNTPAMVDQGATGIFNSNASPEALKKVVELFSAVGKTVVVENEDLIDAVTATSGSGPAYFFLLMEEMIKSAQNLGLSKDAAELLVLQTAKGAAILAEQAADRGEGPAELRRKVTSPGGTTEAAVKIFQDTGFEQTVSRALTKARDRGKELSQQVG